MKTIVGSLGLSLLLHLAHPATIAAKIQTTNNPPTKPILSEYWCGPDVGCGGQSSNLAINDPINGGDLNQYVTDVFVAFALIDTSGNASFTLLPDYMTLQQFNADVTALQKKDIKVIISIGGQGANWEGAWAHPSEFAESVYELVEANHFDGVDLDVEGSFLNGESDSDNLIAVLQDLRSDFNADTSKHLLITVTPECIDVDNQVGEIGAGFNTMVPVIKANFDAKLQEDLIDFIQVQAYNDDPFWPPPPLGTAEFLEQVYNDWVQPFNSGSVNYPGMSASKLVLGVPASTNAANPQYYVQQAELEKAFSDLKQKYGDKFGGAMTWDSYWDSQNQYTVTGVMHDAFANDTSQ